MTGDKQLHRRTRSSVIAAVLSHLHRFRIAGHPQPQDGLYLACVLA
jgi:hypothetical protein